jgi:hypothetical protein
MRIHKSWLFLCAPAAAVWIKWGFKSALVALACSAFWMAFTPPDCHSFGDD